MVDQPLLNLGLRLECAIFDLLLPLGQFAFQVFLFHFEHQLVMSVQEVISFLQPVFHYCLFPLLLLQKLAVCLETLAV